ncbi:hypothetical protein ACWC1D_28650, partial [Streptomyces sp. NPDC001478]
MIGWYGMGGAVLSGSETSSAADDAGQRTSPNTRLRSGAWGTGRSRVGDDRVPTLGADAVPGARGGY